MINAIKYAQIKSIYMYIDITNEIQPGEMKISLKGEHGTINVYS